MIVDDVKRVFLGQYEYCGGFGQNYKSYEKNIVLGEVRMIGGVLHYAYMVSVRAFRKPEISWSRVDGGRGMNLTKES